MAERIPLVYAPGFTQEYYVNGLHYTGSHDRLMRILYLSGFAPYFYQPNWRAPNPRTWADGMVEYAANIADEHENRVTLAGFSCGALTAVLAAEKLQEYSGLEVVGVAAFSLSPYFGEDLFRATHVPRDEKDVWKYSEETKAAFCRLRLPNLDCPVQLYAGEDELGPMHQVHREALAQWPHAQSIRPPSVHNVMSESYLNAVSRNIGELTMGTNSVVA
jgi:pimeloyl-ACP methyl ester carboxylesterase